MDNLILQDFDNDDSYSDSQVVAPPIGDFSMYPPAENTPDPVNPVNFDALPDISKLRPQVNIL